MFFLPPIMLIIGLAGPHWALLRARRAASDEHTIGIRRNRFLVFRKSSAILLFNMVLFSFRSNLLKLSIPHYRKGIATVIAAALLAMPTVGEARSRGECNTLLANILSGATSFPIPVTQFQGAHRSDRFNLSDLPNYDPNAIYIGIANNRPHIPWFAA